LSKKNIIDLQKESPKNLSVLPRDAVKRKEKKNSHIGIEKVRPVMMLESPENVSVAPRDTWPESDSASTNGMYSLCDVQKNVRQKNRIGAKN